MIKKNVYSNFFVAGFVVFLLLIYFIIVWGFSDQIGQRIYILKMIINIFGLVYIYVEHKRKNISFFRLFKFPEGYTKKNYIIDIFYFLSFFFIHYSIHEIIFYYGAKYDYTTTFHFLENPERVYSLIENITCFNFLFYILVIISTPLFEEVFFRGILTEKISGYMSIKKAILLSALLFTFLHTHYLFPFIYAVYFYILYKKSGSLFLPIIFHILINSYWYIETYLINKNIKYYLFMDKSVIYLYFFISFICILIAGKYFYKYFFKKEFKYDTDGYIIYKN